MALSSTVYTVSVELSDVDRGVYESLDLKLARHPSETAEYLVTRLLAYCLEYRDGITFGDGLSAADEPAVAVRDLTGRLTAWIDVGMPAADRIHRASKRAGQVAIYTHRDLRQVLSQLDGQGVHRAAEIPVVSFERGAIETLAGAFDRRTALTLNRIDGVLYVDGPGASVSLPTAPAHFA